MRHTTDIHGFCLVEGSPNKQNPCISVKGTNVTRPILTFLSTDNPSSDGGLPSHYCRRTITTVIYLSITIHDDEFWTQIARSSLAPMMVTSAEKYTEMTQLFVNVPTARESLF